MALDMKSLTRFTVVFLVWGLSSGIGLGLVSSAYAETQVELWQKLEESQLEVQARSLSDTSHLSAHSYESAQLMTLNQDLMRNSLGLNDNSNSNPALRTQAKGKQISEQYEITMPLPDGRIVNLNLSKIN